MSEINVIEFYSRLGVNPYAYIAVLVAIVVVIVLIALMINSMLFKNAFGRISSLDKDSSTVHARVIGIDISKGQRAKAIFEGSEGEEYTLNISKLDAAFLTIHDEGELRFRGDKFVSFKRVDD